MRSPGAGYPFIYLQTSYRQREVSQRKRHIVGAKRRILKCVRLSSLRLLRPRSLSSTGLPFHLIT
jgi:hypothetical protein